MPIITKPSSIQKGTSASFSLDKSALAAVASVAADSYYSQSSNWKEVFLYYKSSTGNQRKVLKFNAELSSPTANFLASEKSRNIFQVQKIVVMDFDGGSVLIPRSELTVADFDVDMTPAPLSGFTWGQIGAGVFNNTSTSVELVSGGSGGYNSGAYSNEVLALSSEGSVTFTYNFSGAGSPYGPIGFSDSTSGGASPIDYGIMVNWYDSAQLALNNTWGSFTPNISPLSPVVYGVTQFKVAIEGSDFVLYQDGIKRDQRAISSVTTATGAQRFWMNFASTNNHSVTVISKTGSWT